MSTGDNRSLGSGISFPQWMKNKNSRFELDPSAFSPTELDDTFMLYYRKPKIETKNTETTIIAANLPENITVATVTKKKADFSQHPISCQKYLPNGQDVTPVPRQNNVEMKIKSPGTDDGFKGEAAKCGSSIIKVASQMISNQGLGLRPCEQEMVQYDGRRRRNSKSLPASPLTSPGGSPKVNRKVNKYFTGAFTDVDKSKGSWILSNLLAKRDLSQSVGHIKEELQEDLERASSTASISESKTPPAFRAKPSELREMNFWSPTSM